MKRSCDDGTSPEERGSVPTISPTRAAGPCTAGSGRRAASLVEVLVVVALTSTIMGAAVSLLAGLQRWDQQFRQRSARNEQSIQLAEAIRQDLRTASEASLADRHALEIRLPGGGTIRYELDRSVCKRTVEPGGSARPPIERFAVAPEAEWSLERKPAGRRPLIVVLLQQFDSPEGTGDRNISLLVYGALGADLATGDLTAPTNE